MTDRDKLIGRIAESQRRVLKRRALIAEVDLPAYLAHAIVDEFQLTVHGDDCGYHEIHGSYDTRFEED